MGIITEYTDVNTGLTIPEAYISLCCGEQHMLLGSEEVAAARAGNPATTHGRWSCTAVMSIFSSKNARLTNKNPINKHQLTIYFDEIAYMPTVAYQELKKAFPQHTDDL